MTDFVSQLGDALVVAAERQADHAARWRPSAWWTRHGSTRALVLIGAVALVGAGGTAGLLATRGHVGGPPSLTFARVSPQQEAAGIRALTRPVVFARGRLSGSNREWQLVGFQTTRGFCIDLDWPRQGGAGGCGTNVPRNGRALDWQGQIPFARRKHGVIVGAASSATAAVRVNYLHSVRQGMLHVPARMIHVSDPRVLAAMGLRRPFAYYLAELDGPFFAMSADAFDAHGDQLGRAGIPDDMADTPGGSFMVPGRGCEGPDLNGLRPRLVSTLPPASVRAVLAVLRRPQRDDDVPPPDFMHAVVEASWYATVEVDAIRHLGRTSDGAELYLVPGTERVPSGPGAGCLRTLTPRGRAREARRQELIRRNASGLKFTLYAWGPHGGGTAAGFDLERMRAGRPNYGIAGHRVVGMVPDGVASVELQFTHGIRRTAVVHENHWVVFVPTNAGATRLRKEVWRRR